LPSPLPPTLSSELGISGFDQPLLPGGKRLVLGRGEGRRRRGKEEERRERKGERRCKKVDIVATSWARG